MIEKLRQRLDRSLAGVDPATLLFAVAAALILVSVLKDLALLVVGRDRELTNLLAFATFKSGTDSWMPMYRAVDLFRSDPGAGIYQTVFFEQATKFQYPPTSLAPFVGLSTLGVSADGGIVLMQAISWIAVLAIIAVTAMIYRDQRTLPGLATFRAQPCADALVVAGIAVATLTFDPISYAYEVGQIQVLIDLAVGGALLLWLKDKKGAAGAVMALAALVKPQYGLVLLWSLLRREHRFSIGFLATGAPIGLISLAVFGIDEHFAYLSVVSYIGRHGEVFWANQSVNGLLNRLLNPSGVGTDAMLWNAQAFAPFNPVVYAGTMISTLAFVLLGLGFRPRWARRKADPPAAAARQESALDLATMIVALTLASPIAWEHHYGVTLPITALAFISLADLRGRGLGRGADMLLIGLATGYLLVSNYLTQLFPVAGTPLNVLQSYQLFGGLALFAVLIGLRSALNPATAQGPSAAAAIVKDV